MLNDGSGLFKKQVHTLRKSLAFPLKTMVVVVGGTFLHFKFIAYVWSDFFPPTLCFTVLVKPSITWLGMSV